MKINLGGSTKLYSPLVVLGSGMDAMENQLFTSVSVNYEINSSYVLNDRTRTYKGKSIESYDIIVVGGPGHNAYAKELLDRGLLTYTATSMKTPGLVIEAVRLPTGRMVLIVASTAGYPYLERTSIDGSNSPGPSQTVVSPNPGSGVTIRPDYNAETELSSVNDEMQDVVGSLISLTQQVQSIIDKQNSLDLHNELLNEMLKNQQQDRWKIQADIQINRFESAQDVVSNMAVINHNRYPELEKFFNR